MEHSQTNMDALRSDHEERDSKMFANVSHDIELYSKRRSCYMEHNQGNIDEWRSDNEEADWRMFVHVSQAM